MAKMVSLPDNEKRHFDIGEQALQKGNYASAAAHFEKAYEADQSYAIAQPLAASLNGLKQFHESLNVMLPHYQAFMQTDADVQLMLDAWLGTLNFVMARGMLRHFDVVRRATFDRQIDAAEALALSSRGEQIASLVRKIS
ncbi:TPR repeat-containing protein like ysoA, partial [Lacticaseibacillus paracasei subsp. paracasei Lpp48]